MQSDFDNNLQSYFTDMEYLHGMFKDYVAAPSLPKRIIVIHGVGGSGKSSLLSMFRIHCKSEKVPVALASGDGAKSVLDILARWMEDLKAGGVKFPSLSKTMETYRAIQAKVDEQAKKTQNASGRMADIASKAASKTAETAGGALLGAAIGSVIPGVGTAIGGALGGVVSGMGAEALTDWLRGFLTKPDTDLLLDPTKRLTADFLEDMGKAAEKKRIVLLLDTYEQMTALEDWVGEVAQKIHPNVLAVIAGRKLPYWNRTWQGWMMSAQVEELKPMTEDVMRELIRRYYATMRGGEPEPAQVEAIIRFARGLPIVITSAVQLWVIYGIEDFHSVKAKIVADLVDRLMEGVPSALIPALEAAAVVRWFDQPILRAVTGLEDVRDVYSELRRFPFVRTRVEGLALHDSVREMMDENLRVQDSERHSELHESAAVYFEKRLEKTTGEEAERLGLERLYHRVRTDEEAGIKLFQKMAEELGHYRLVSRLRVLLNDVSNYPFRFANSTLWLDYYKAGLAYMEVRFDEAEKTYLTISESNNAEQKLQAYALSEIGRIRTRTRYMNKENGLKSLVLTIERSNNLLAPLDPRRGLNLINLGGVYWRIGDDERALDCYQQAVDFLKQHGGRYEAANAFSAMIKMFAVRGEWRKMFDAQAKGLANLTGMDKSLRGDILGNWTVAWSWAGRYNESANNARAMLETKKELGEVAVFGALRDLGFALGMQGKYSQAYDSFSEAVQNYQNVLKRDDASTLCFWAAVLFKQGDSEKSEELLVKSISAYRNQRAPRVFRDNLYYHGQICEMRKDWHTAEDLYTNCIAHPREYFRYFVSAALIGLVRVKHGQGDYTAIPLLLAEAEQLAQQYEYNDHLASLRLTQGHLAWENGNQPNVLSFYQRAIIYALRYNRFLLDELLSGRPQGTPLNPIIPYCFERGEDGKKILIELRDWWKNGTNHIGTLRPDTISPIPENISLLEAEKIARERELGDGSPQKSVIQQIETVL